MDAVPAVKEFKDTETLSMIAGSFLGKGINKTLAGIIMNLTFVL